MDRQKIVVCIMGQNCERFIDMAIDSVKDADDIIYCDGGSTDNTLKICKEKNVSYIIHQEYNQEDKAMNGKQRNFYLKFMKEFLSDYWALCIDADEVVEDFNKIKEWIQTVPKGLYSVKMRHFIGDIGHEDSTVKEHFVLNRLFKIECADKYPEVEHPVLQAIAGTQIAGTKCTTIWHLAYVPNLWEIKKRYENHMKKSNMHSPGFLKNWYVQHLFGQYPKTPIFPLEVPRIIMDKFGINYDEIYFNYHSTLEAKHFLMMSQWKDYFYKKHPGAENEYSIKMLDIGCGIGLYGIAAKTLGIEWRGIEKSEWAVKNTNRGIIQGDITNLNVDGEFDMILCIDVLEHLDYKELDKALDNIKDLGEIFILSIPFMGDPNLEQDPTHKIKESKDWWINKLSQYFKVKEAPKEWMFSNQILIGESQ